MGHEHIAYDTYILPFATQVKHRYAPPPGVDYPVKAKVIFCVRGVATPPCCDCRRQFRRLGLSLGGVWESASAIGLALLAWVFGLRHGVNAEYITVIDNAVRMLPQDGRSATGVGFYFSLGHSTVVDWPQRQLLRRPVICRAIGTDCAMSAGYSAPPFLQSFYCDCVRNSWRAAGRLATVPGDIPRACTA
jgi:hypothetical protein